METHGKAALNFQFTALIAILVGGTAAFVLSYFCIGFLLFPVVGLLVLAVLVFPIIAGIKANDGRPFKYPCTIEFLK